MINRDYYSVRTGKLSPDPEIDLKILIRLFIVAYDKLDEQGYFQKYFGYECVDEGFVSGELGEDLEAILLFNLKKANLYPIKVKISGCSEDDLFDIIEFLYDHSSKPLEGNYHSWQGCGYHYNKFDDSEGRAYFIELINPLLKSYKNGFELSNEGEILRSVDTGLSFLIEAEIPTNDPENITQKIEQAIIKFRRHRSSAEERQDAIRDLADVLEYLRPEAKKYLEKDDESDLFNIANNFGIRHHNDKQKNKYDKGIWHSWMFYYYLSTIHALLRMIEKNNSSV